MEPSIVFNANQNNFSLAFLLDPLYCKDIQKPTNSLQFIELSNGDYFTKEIICNNNYIFHISQIKDGDWFRIKKNSNNSFDLIEIECYNEHDGISFPVIPM